MYPFNDRIRGSIEGRISVRLGNGYWFNVFWYRYEFDREKDNLQDDRTAGARLSLSIGF